MEFLLADFRVSAVDIAGVGGLISGSAAEFEARLASCQAAVVGLIGADWSGSAADAFAAGWVEWLQGAGEVHESLRCISRLLGEASTAYESTESQVVRGSTDSSVSVVGSLQLGGE